MVRRGDGVAPAIAQRSVEGQKRQRAPRAATTDENGYASLWRNPADKRRERDLKKDAVLRTAASLFVERGFHRTTISDVANRLGLTKPAVYHYFESKDQILLECYRRGGEMINAALDEAENKTETGYGRVASFISSFVRVVVVDVGACLAQIDDSDLPEDNRAEIRHVRKGIEARLRSYLTQGVSDGSVRSCDVAMTAFAIITALNGVGTWYREGGRLTIDQIAEHMVDLFGRALANGSEAGARKKARSRPATGEVAAVETARDR